MLSEHDPSADLASLVSRYAERFHTLAGNEHHVASPLGAWLLLALSAKGSTGVARKEISAALGVEVIVAAEFAARLVNAPHPALASGVALWTGPDVTTDRLSAWLDDLPSVVVRGGIPSNDAIDRWVNEHTLGLIERFPVRVTPLTLFVLASALATRVSWDEPFEITPGRDLGEASAWSRQVKLALRSPGDTGHSHFIATTPRAGDVAVYVAHARQGLNVMSVIAGADVPPAAVRSSAHELAIAFASGQDVPRRSLFDLRLGESALWTLSERPSSGEGPEERYTAVLPAWSAQSNHDLTNPDLGFSALAAGLVAASGSEANEYDARQSVAARYHRLGFEAAAVTSLMLSRALLRDTRIVRTAALRFGHPFAVVAVATEAPRFESIAKGFVYGPWHGVPVFSGWITNPDEADETPAHDMSLMGIIRRLMARLQLHARR